MSDPFTALHFRVEIMLPGAAEPLCEAAFAECDGLELRFDVITSPRAARTPAAPDPRPGLDRPGHAPARDDQLADLWDWCESVQRTRDCAPTCAS